MGRIIAVYGIIAGIIVIIGMGVGMTLIPEGGSGGMVAGYLAMLVALSMAFVGTRQYRDTVKGGVVRFWPALGVGLAIGLVACVFYVLGWEVYMYQTNDTFMDDYISGSIATMRAEGKPASAILAFEQEMADMRVQYAKPHIRMLFTLSEIAPVALIVALISAGLLRNSNFLPPKAR